MENGLYYFTYLSSFCFTAIPTLSILAQKKSYFLVSAPARLEKKMLDYAIHLQSLFRNVLYKFSLFSLLRRLKKPVLCRGQWFFATQYFESFFSVL